MKRKLARLFEDSKALLLQKVKKVKDPANFSFVYMGDSWAGAGETANAIFQVALEEARKHNPLFILHGGDAVFSGTVEQFVTGRDYRTETGTRHVKSFLDIVNQQVLHPDPKVSKVRIPLFVFPGNHEQNGLNGSLNNFVKFIGPTNFLLNIPKLKLSVMGLKNFFVTKQNGQTKTEYGFTPGELNLLRNYLSRRQKYTFLGMHAPPHAGKWANPNYFTDPESTFKIGLKPFLRLTKGKIAKGLVGHVHAYDRANIQGTEYILSGGAGAPLVRLGFLSSKSSVAKEAFHIVLITVKNGQITQRFTPIGFTA